MTRIIIDFDEQEVQTQDALAEVLMVVSKGKPNGKYCGATVFPNGNVVHVRKKKKRQLSDSFHVYKDRKPFF